MLRADPRIDMIALYVPRKRFPERIDFIARQNFRPIGCDSERLGDGKRRFGAVAVIMTVLTPARLQAATASFAPSLGGSYSATIPKNVSEVSLSPSANASTLMADDANSEMRSSIFCRFDCVIVVPS